MTFIRPIGGAATLGAAMVLGFGLSTPTAQAAYVVTLEEVGSNVVATGSGTIDLSGLTFFFSLEDAASVTPNLGIITTGPTSFTPISYYEDYEGFSGPQSFGSGGPSNASTGSGDAVGFGRKLLILAVPQGYVSGNPLSDTSTYDGQTFASLGVTPGTYVWTWGSGPTDDRFTLKIGFPVPEPSGVLLLSMPLGLVMLHAARRGRANS